VGDKVPEIVARVDETHADAGHIHPARLLDANHPHPCSRLVLADLERDMKLAAQRYRTLGLEERAAGADIVDVPDERPGLPRVGVDQPRGAVAAPAGVVGTGFLTGLCTTLLMIWRTVVGFSR
jgi:hypothetical protein